MPEHRHVLHLRNALQAMMPDCDVQIVWQVDWFSMVFAGYRIGFRITVSGALAHRRASEFQASLPETEFEVSGYLVADLAPAVVTVADDAAIIEVEALIVQE